MCKLCALVRVVTRSAMLAALVGASLLSVEPAFAEEKEPAAIIGLGAAGEWDLPNGGASFGPSASIEFVPIKSWKDWLVIEAGVAPLFGRGQTEWDTDVVFKKPFDLTPSIEIEPGIGPAWEHASAGGRTTDAIAGEAVVEFMIWPTPARKFGWFVEPSYTMDFSRGQQSLGVTAGLLFAIQ